MYISSFIGYIWSNSIGRIEPNVSDQTQNLPLSTNYKTATCFSVPEFYHVVRRRTLRMASPEQARRANQKFRFGKGGGNDGQHSVAPVGPAGSLGL